VERWRVGILGATGLVGQRLVERLAGHPWFAIEVLAASDRSAGRPYAKAARWVLGDDPPAEVRGTVVRLCTPEDLSGCDLVLSGLEAGIAADLEPALARAGLPVISNSSAHRTDPEVPVLVPEVNAAHLALVESQRARLGGPGFIVTNPNCSTTGLALALAPLHRAFGIRRCVVATLQALSGAGLEGPRGLDTVDNVIPFILGEEEKMERELAKILGAPIAVSAHCHRIPTLDGHLEAVSVELERAVSPAEAAAALREFEGDVAGLGLPTAPVRPIVVRDEPDRPQPRLDRNAGGGMSVTVGRIRPCPVFTLRFVLLSHNAVRGAAGGTVLNAELLAARGLLARRGRA